MMNSPQFSVVIPLYNKEQHILRTLKSIQEQRYAAAEIIVVDDGSSDNGAMLVEQLNWPNLTLIRQKNQGVSAARNTGVASATHSFVAFLDADDEWLPLYLAEMAALINRFPQAGLYASRYQIVASDAHYVDADIYLPKVNPNGMLLHNYFHIASQGNLPFMTSSTTVRREIFENIGGFPEGESMGEDQTLFCNMALKSTIAYSPNIHLLYHCDAQNQATQHHIPGSECAFSQRIHILAEQAQYADLKQDMLRYCAAHLCHIAKLNIQQRRFGIARQLLSDPRTKLKIKHRLALLSWSWLKQSQLLCKHLLNRCIHTLYKVKKSNSISF
jgi:GT2 family glycosyltransferase